MSRCPSGVIQRLLSELPLPNFRYSVFLTAGFQASFPARNQQEKASTEGRGLTKLASAW